MTQGTRTKKLISIFTPCYNEEGNVENNYQAVKEVFAALPQYDYEHIFIDNASKDRTQEILRKLAAQDKNVKVIFNVRNFGPVRSPHYGILQSQGDCAVMLYADLQDPPSLIKDFLVKWEEGFPVVLGVKTQSEESFVMFAIRKAYYNLSGGISDVKLVKNNNGFGLYDKKIIEILRTIDDPVPYFRGLVAELGFNSAHVHYKQKSRKRGISSHNFYSLYDIAMTGITNNSKVPLRLATLLGFFASAVCMVLAITYFIIKLIFWNQLVMGTAPILIGLFTFSSIQLFFIGILGEYLGAIHTQVHKRPLVIERERINFSS